MPRNPTHYESGPNMTPLVDVVMVILIFLMLAGQFGGAEHFLTSNVPMATGPGTPVTAVAIDEPIEIRIDSPSPDRFIARTGNITATTAPQLTEALTHLRKNLNAAGKKTSDLQLKLVPARDVKFEHVVAVHEASMNAAFEKIGFARSH